MAVELDHATDVLKAYWLNDEPTMTAAPEESLLDENGEARDQDAFKKWMDENGRGRYTDGILIFKAEGPVHADLPLFFRPVQLQDPRPAAEAPELQVNYSHLTTETQEPQHFKPVRIDVKSMVLVKCACADEKLKDAFLDILRIALNLGEMTGPDIESLFQSKPGFDLHADVVLHEDFVSQVLEHNREQRPRSFYSHWRRVRRAWQRRLHNLGLLPDPELQLFGLGLCREEMRDSETGETWWKQHLEFKFSVGGAVPLGRDRLLRLRTDALFDALPRNPDTRLFIVNLHIQGGGPQDAEHSLDAALERAGAMWKTAILRELWNTAADLQRGGRPQTLRVHGLQESKKLPVSLPVLRLQSRENFPPGDPRALVSEHYFAWPDKWPGRVVRAGGPGVLDPLVQALLAAAALPRVQRAKTQLCKYHFRWRNCRNGSDCDFAHSVQEISGLWEQVVP